MKDKKLSLAELKRHIKKCKKHNKNFGFLGLVENRDLTPEVESLFKFTTPYGYILGYDWVNGNDKLKQLIKEI